MLGFAWHMQVYHGRYKKRTSGGWGGEARKRQKKKCRRSRRGRIAWSSSRQTNRSYVMEASSLLAHSEMSHTHEDVSIQRVAKWMCCLCIYFHPKNTFAIFCWIFSIVYSSLWDCNWSMTSRIDRWSVNTRPYHDISTLRSFDIRNCYFRIFHCQN